MTTNNEYLKGILEKVTETTVTGNHTDNYYLKRIAETLCSKSYSENLCNGKYIKDIAESVCETTYTGHHFNNYYWHRIAEFLSGNTYSHRSDNFFLGIVFQYIDSPSVPFDSVVLTVGKSILSYADGDSTSLSAQLMNGQEEAHLSGKSVSFDIVDGQGNVISNIGSDDTDSDGIATVTYTSTGIGDITIQASVTNDSDTYTDTEDIEDIWKYVGTDTTTIQNALTSYTLYPMNSSTATVTTDGTDIIIQSGNVGVNMWNRGELSFLNGFNNFSMSMVIKGGTGFGFHLHNNDKLYLFTGASVLADTYVNKNTWSAPSLVQLDSSKEYIMEMTYNSGSLLLKIFNLDGTEVLNTSRSVASNMSRFGFCYPKNSTQKFRDLKVKAVQSINISATADVLSYADSDTTTLTATLSPVASGKTVKIYQDDVLVATEQTDSNGQVSYTYTSQGIGDTVFKFKSGSIEETKTIEDCWKYWASVTSTISPNLDLPQNFSIDYEVKITQTSRQAHEVIFGNDNDNRLLFGYIQDATTYQMWSIVNGVQSKTNSTKSMPLNTWTANRIEVINGTASHSPSDLSITPPSTTNLNKLLTLLHYNSSYSAFREFKIKPL